MKQYDKDYYWSQAKIKRFFYFGAMFVMVCLLYEGMGMGIFKSPVFYFLLLSIHLNIIYGNYDRRLVFLLKDLDEEKFNKLHIYSSGEDAASVQSSLTMINYINFLCDKDDFGNAEVRMLKKKLKVFILVTFFGFMAFVFGMLLSGFFV